MDSFKAYRDFRLLEETAFRATKLPTYTKYQLGQFIRHHEDKKDYIYKACVLERDKRLAREEARHKKEEEKRREQEEKMSYMDDWEAYDKWSDPEEKKNLPRVPDEGRIFLDMKSVKSEILNKIPERIWASKTTTFLDPSMGNGQLIDEIIERLRSKGHSDKNIARRVFGAENNPVLVNEFENRNSYLKNMDKSNPIGTFVTADENNLEEVLGNMKFDVVVGNPPYEGNKGLHQQFFNLAVNALKDGGHMVFIQPANPYINRKRVARKEVEQQMLTNIMNFKTSVKFVDPSIFQTALIGTDLAITHLTKVPGNTTVENVEYKDGTVYKNVELEDINGLGIEPKLFRKLSSKLDRYIDEHGSLGDIISRDPKANKLRLQKIRGTKGTNDFYTFISRDQKYWGREGEFGLALKKESQRKNVVSYLKTYIARFAYARVKIHNNHDRTELFHVPLVNFVQEWNDEKLMKEFGITRAEYKEIRRVIPKYYDDVG